MKKLKNILQKKAIIATLAFAGLTNSGFATQVFLSYDGTSKANGGETLGSAYYVLVSDLISALGQPSTATTALVAKNDLAKLIVNDVDAVYAGLQSSLLIKALGGNPAATDDATAAKNAVAAELVANSDAASFAQNAVIAGLGGTAATTKTTADAQAAVWGGLGSYTLAADADVTAMHNAAAGSLTTFVTVE